LNSNDAILKSAAGFTTGSWFFHSSSLATTVYVFDGLNVQGNGLGSLLFAAQGFNHCAGIRTELSVTGRLQA